MSWEIKQVDEFEEWFGQQDQDTQESIVAMFPVLRERGPQLGRPFVDSLNDSRHANMKEMRPTRTVRVFFAFDPERTAILLIGGDKAGKPERRWYRQMIRKADQIYDAHLKTLNRK